MGGGIGAMKNDDRVKCKFCEWSRQKWFRSGGRLHGPEDAFKSLVDHVISEHPLEYDDIEAWIEETK